jgi:hypothetical protein
MNTKSSGGRPYFSSRVKKWAFSVGAPVIAVAAVGAIAYASVPVTFVAGNPLRAADLNSDFSSLDGRITALETAAPTYATGSQLDAGIAELQSQITTLQTPTSLPGKLHYYAVSGTALAAPCAISSGAVVDCTCPAGSFVVSGGAAANDATGDSVRETRPISTTAWRMTCLSGTTNVLCANYNLLCSILGP